MLQKSGSKRQVGACSPQKQMQDFFVSLGTRHCPKPAAKAAMLEAYMHNLDGFIARIHSVANIANALW